MFVFVIVIFLLFIINFNTYAQKLQIRQDFGVWGGLKVSQEFHKDFEWSLEQQLRTWRNSTRIDKYFAELGLKYRINKNFSLGGKLRYIHDTNQWNRSENGIRYNVGLQFKIKLHKSIRFFYRVAYQQKFTYDIGGITPNITRATRHKLKIQFKHRKRHKFYTSVELFVKRESLRAAYFDRLRFGVGDKIKTQKGAVDVGLGYEVNLQPQDPFSFFFVKFVYNFKI